jgi:amino acid efflux transporter
MTGLKRTLSVWRGAGLMLNIVIGAGLLALPGLVVDQAAGQALWAWLACTLVAVPLLAVFVIMGKRFPNAGGIAHFCEMAFGRSLYGAASFVFLGAVVFGLPGIALTGGYYLAEILPGQPVHFAAGLILLGALAHAVSPEIAGRVSSLIASTMLAALLVLIALGLTVVDWDGVGERIAPVASLEPAGLIAPFMMIFFAFTGWEVAAGLSEEFRDPGRDFPKAMALSFAGAVAVYVAMAFIAQTVPLGDTHEAAFVAIAKLAAGQAGAVFVALLAGLIIVANLTGAIWAVSRMVYALSRERVLPLGLTTTEAGSPLSSVALTAAALLGVLAFEWLGVLDIAGMLAIAGQNFFILYGLSALALWRLTDARWEQGLALLVTALVAALAVYEDSGVAYPIALALAGAALAKATQARRAPAE